jgi:hypothetical protein
LQGGSKKGVVITVGVDVFEGGMEEEVEEEAEAIVEDEIEYGGEDKAEEMSSIM